MENKEHTLAEKIGDYLKVKRLEKGWSQMKLAGDSDVHMTYLSQMEGGKRDNFSLSVLKKVTDTLGLEIKIGDIYL